MSSGKSALSIVKKYYPNVTRVRDARRSTKVHVSQDDCDSSKMKAPNACAMATAFTRKHDAAIVSLAVAYLIDGNTAIRYMVPSSVAREIVSFDRSKVFAPGMYRLDKPSSTEKIGARRANRPKVKSNAKHKKIVRRVHRTVGIRSL